ncbi:hypothetical protein V1286_002684 [Bradyrhizobium algeriense]|uniref:Uncharacterized protein n=1 Tax=Bradyrhizobium algeriense TaxID=634784 RepID=A0ABU8B9J4_9BRAD
MTETVSVRLVGGSDGERATFEVSDEENRCLLTCRYRDKTISSEAADFFDALVSIRRQLQHDGLIPYCYGASLNVFPSTMARDMGRGLKAYKLAPGKHSNRADLVGIFDEGTDVVPADVDAQEQFFRDWIESPRS